MVCAVAVRCDNVVSHCTCTVYTLSALHAQYTHFAGTVIVDNWKADGVACLFACLLTITCFASLRFYRWNSIGTLPWPGSHLMNENCLRWFGASWWLRFWLKNFLCKKIDSVYDEAFYSRRNVMNQLTFDFIPFQSMKLLSCTDLYF